MNSFLPCGGRLQSCPGSMRSRRRVFPRSRSLSLLAAGVLGFSVPSARAQESRVVFSDGDSPAVVVRYDVDACSGTVAFDASETTGSAPGCRINRFQWWFGEGKARAWPDSRRPDPAYRFRASGDHVVTLVVTDQCRKSRSATIEVHVPRAPTPTPVDLQIHSSKDRASTGESVTFQVSGDDLGDEGRAYDWDFGDGSPFDSRPRPTHVFAEDGVHTVTLTVTDACGRTATATTEIAVGPIDPPPVIDTQIGRVVEAPTAQTVDTFDAAAQTAMGLPQPVICALSDAVAGVAGSEGRVEDGEPVVHGAADLDVAPTVRPATSP